MALIALDASAFAAAPALVAEDYDRDVLRSAIWGAALAGRLPGANGGANGGGADSGLTGATTTAGADGGAGAPAAADPGAAAAANAAAVGALKVHLFDMRTGDLNAALAEKGACVVQCVRSRIAGVFLDWSCLFGRLSVPEPVFFPQNPHLESNNKTNEKSNQTEPKQAAPPRAASCAPSRLRPTTSSRSSPRPPARRAAPCSSWRTPGPGSPRCARRGASRASSATPSTRRSTWRAPPPPSGS